MSDTFHELKLACDEQIGRHVVFMWGRFILILVGLLFTFASRRFRRARLFIFFMSALELNAEHLLYHLSDTKKLTRSQSDLFISFLRRYDGPIYNLVVVLSFVSSFISTGKQPDEIEETTPNTPIRKSEINTVVETIQRQMTAEKEAHKREQEQFREQFLSLQLQLNERFAATESYGSNCATPISGMSQHGHSIPANEDPNSSSTSIVTPSINLNSRLADNGTSSPEFVLSPPREEFVSITSKQSRQKRKRRDQGSSSDEESLNDTNEAKKQRQRS